MVPNDSLINALRELGYSYKNPKRIACWSTRKPVATTECLSDVTDTIRQDLVSDSFETG